MTEITVPKNTFFPNHSPQRYLVDPVAFAVAMIGGPVLVGLVGLPTVILPAATLFGGPLYLFPGIPVMLVAMARQRFTPRRWASLALKTHVTIFIPIALLEVWLSPGGNTASFYLLFGLFFAPIWGYFSGLIYGWLERDFYKQTL